MSSGRSWSLTLVSRLTLSSSSVANATSESEGSDVDVDESGGDSSDLESDEAIDVTAELILGE